MRVDNMNRMMLEMRSQQIAMQNRVQDMASAAVPLEERVQNATALQKTGETQGPSFGTLLVQAIDKVDALSDDATRLRTDFERGVQGVDLPQVMIASQKASVAFSAMTEVRNKMISAYDEIMKMPV